MALFDFFKKKRNQPQADEPALQDITPQQFEPVTEPQEESYDEPLEESPVITEEIIPDEPLPVEEQQPAEDTTVSQQQIIGEQIIGEEIIGEATIVEEEPEEQPYIIEEESVWQPESVKPEKKGFFKKMLAGLDKTRKNIIGNVESVLKSFVKIDEALYEELEEALIAADIGVTTSTTLIDKLRERVSNEKATEIGQVRAILIDEITSILQEDNNEFVVSSPCIMLVIGVNGVGKTTTIGKLAANFKASGKTVVLAAADTFRAAAIDQLEIWGQRSEIPVIKHQENSDPAAVVFDAIQAAKARRADILICDTAGRLHNKKNLMEELRKMSKIINREYPEAQTEVLIVLDATTGQNALQQAKTFKEICDITGIVLTKLDGTAKGGIIIAIKNELKIPIRFVGVGEGIDDLQPFDPEQFAKALFDMGE